LPTKEARAALPDVVTHADAAFNLGRMALLVAGLADHRVLRPEAGEDRLHQPHRAALYPEAEPLLRGLLSAGALLSCWSGAGPSLLAVCERAAAPAVRGRAEALLGDVGLAGRAIWLEHDRRGLVIES
jgi:homoserine kinase